MYSHLKKTNANYNISESYSFFESNFIIGSSELKIKIIDYPVKDSGKSDIVYFNELPGVAKLPISSFIQRNLDEERVKDIYKGYLKRESGIKFYPPIIASFIPFKNQTLEGKFNGTYSVEKTKNVIHKIKTEYNLIDKTTFDQNSNKGIFEIKETQESEGGLIAWDKENIRLIIIDGQHRLKSLEKYYNQKDLKFDQLSIPICILDLRDYEDSVIKALRDIFIALNDRAKAIDPGRLILLNDYDISSVLVQEILNYIDDASDDKVKELKQMIDLSCDKNKHSDEHLTGVTTLYYILYDTFFDRKVFDLSDIKSHTINKAKNFIKAIDGTLKVLEPFQLNKPADLKVYNLSIEDNLNNQLSTENKEEDSEDDNDSNVFYLKLKQGHFNLIRNNFKKKLIQSILKIFTETTPYQKYIDDFEKLSDTDKEILLRKGLGDKNQKELNDLKQSKKQYEIMRSVVGQKGLFYVFFKKYYLQGKNVSDFIEDINSLVETFSDIFEKKKTITIDNKNCDFWDGICLRNNNMDNSLNAAKRISYVLSFLLACQKSNQDTLRKIQKHLNNKNFENLKNLIGGLFDIKVLNSGFTRHSLNTGQNSDQSPKLLHLYLSACVKMFGNNR